MAAPATFAKSPAVRAAVVALAIGLVFAAVSMRSNRDMPGPELAGPILNAAFAGGRQVFAEGGGGLETDARIARHQIAATLSFRCVAAPADPLQPQSGRRDPPLPRYDCIYRLRGTTGAIYLAVVRLARTNDEVRRDVGAYAIDSLTREAASRVLRNTGAMQP